MSDHAASSGAPRQVLQGLLANQREFLAFLERRVGDRALAEDLLQEAFARSLDKLATLREEESAVAWFYRVLRNAVIDHHRRRAAASRQLETFVAELEAGVQPPPDVHVAVCRCVGELAMALKPEYAEALRRVELEGLPVKQYAAEAGITDSNAGVRVFRARQALRQRVAVCCGACADQGCLDCTCGHPGPA